MSFIKIVNEIITYNVDDLKTQLHIIVHKETIEEALHKINDIAEKKTQANEFIKKYLKK